MMLMWKRLRLVGILRGRVHRSWLLLLLLLRLRWQLLLRLVRTWAWVTDLSLTRRTDRRRLSVIH